MKRVIALLLMTILLSISSTGMAQAVREATHIVQPGETLAVIASQYDVDLNSLAAANQIYNYHLIHSWRELAIPGETSVVSQPAADAITHVVSYGETLGGIADIHGVNLYELMILNGLYSHVIYPGHVLQVPSQTSAPVESDVVEDPGPTTVLDKHVVQYGETLGAIAAAYGINLNALIVENGIFGYIIYPGQVLILPGTTVAPDSAPPASETIADEIEATADVILVTYVVQPGDTLGILAEAYGITLLELMSANDIFYPHRIVVGQELLVPSTGLATLTVANAELLNTESATPVENSEPPTVTDPPAPVVIVPPPDHFEHTVQFHETLSAIASHYGISMVDLMSTNGIVDANRIDQGQTLWIPPTAITRDPLPAPVAPVTVSTTETVSAAVSAGEREQYTVQPGEYLSQIGNKLGMNWVAIAEVNGLVNPDSLHAGMVLLVPNAEELAKYPASYGWNHYDLYSNDPGPRVGVGREFVVVLSTQRAYAYENGILQKAALVSTGLPATPTVQGNYAIYRKRRSQSMRGPGYDLDNVEWVMFFYQGYSFHGTWWHNNFGQPMSHGCVNMTNPDAKWFYEFGSIGTPVHVRYY